MLTNNYLKVCCVLMYAFGSNGVGSKGEMTYVFNNICILFLEIYVFMYLSMVCLGERRPGRGTRRPTRGWPARGQGT